MQKPSDVQDRLPGDNQLHEDIKHLLNITVKTNFTHNGGKKWTVTAVGFPILHDRTLKDNSTSCAH